MDHGRTLKWMIQNAGHPRAAQTGSLFLVKGRSRSCFAVVATVSLYISVTEPNCILKVPVVHPECTVERRGRQAVSLT